jgi:3',5'-nucleoside bisphosphate phosphatase
LAQIQKANLHIHTNCSDGKFSPKEIISLSISKDIRTISITDHDTTGALDIAVEYGKQFDVEVIPGIELSSNFIEGERNREIHILGYFIDYKNIKLQNFLLENKISRRKRLKKIITALNDIGLNLTLEDVKARYGDEIPVGRPHIAHLLAEKKFVKSYYEAFDKYLGDGKPISIKKENPSVKDSVKILKQAGCFVFIAHPGIKLNEEDLNKLLDLKIDGIEVYHPMHTRTRTKQFLKFALQKNLLICGGSDFHGVGNDHLNFDKFTVPLECVMRMKKLKGLI